LPQQGFTSILKTNIPWSYNVVIRSRCFLAFVLLFGVWPLAAREGHADAVACPNGDLHEVQESESSFTLQGKITQKSEGKLTVSSEENIVFHVRYDEKTDIRLKDGTQGSDQDLKTGLTVTVQGEFNKSGEIVAHKIQVLQ
jgi:hypothetical protein